MHFGFVLILHGARFAGNFYLTNSRNDSVSWNTTLPFWTTATLRTLGRLGCNGTEGFAGAGLI